MIDLEKKFTSSYCLIHINFLAFHSRNLFNKLTQEKSLSAPRVAEALKRNIESCCHCKS